MSRAFASLGIFRFASSNPTSGNPSILWFFFIRVTTTRDRDGTDLIYGQTINEYFCRGSRHSLFAELSASRDGNCKRRTQQTSIPFKKYSSRDRSQCLRIVFTSAYHTSPMQIRHNSSSPSIQLESLPSESAFFSLQPLSVVAEFELVQIPNSSEAAE